MVRHEDFAFGVPLVGRDNVLEEIRGTIESGQRCVALIGPPGVGKTRLAREVCLRSEDILGLSRDNVVFCSLVGADSAEEVTARVSDAVDLPAELRDQLPAQGALVRWIANGRRLGLVLDNAESAAEHVASLANSVLDAARNTLILVTSRVVVPGRGAANITVPPLPANTDGRDESPASKLFRLCAGLGDASLGRDDASRVESIAVRLDGLPLSLELAARRLSVLSLEQLESHLEDRFAATRDGTAVDAPPPYHHALWQTLEWSWNLLHSWQQSALMQLSVFQGDFTLELAEAVVALPGDGPAAPTVVDALQALVRSSLLVRRGDWRSSGTFFMLETIRDFARRKLDQNPAPNGLWDRYSQAVVEYVERLGNAVPTNAAERALAGLAILRGDVLAVALNTHIGPPAEPTLRARAVLAMSEYLNNRGERKRHLELIDVALQALGVNPDDSVTNEARSGNTADPAAATLPRDRARLASLLLWRRAGNHNNMSHFGEAIAAGTRALALADQCEDPWLQAAGHSSLFSALLLQDASGNAAIVAHHATRARALVEQADGAERLMIPIASGEGILALRRGDNNAARKHFESGVEWAERAGHELLKAGLLTNLANVHQTNGDVDAANAVLDQAIHIYEEHGTQRPLYVALGTRAINDFGQGKPNLGELQRVVDGFHRVGDERYAAYYTFQCGLVELLQGDVPAARQSMESVVEELSPLKDPYNLPIAQCVLGTLDALDGDGESGARAFQDATTFADEVKSWPHFYQCRDRLAVVRDCASGTLTADEAHSRLDELVAEQKSENTGMTRVVQALLSRVSQRTDGWVFDESGQWFQTPDGQKVDLGRRKAPKRILAAFGALYNGARDWSDGVSSIDLSGRRGFTRDELFMIGWPGQSIDESAAANRVYVALSTLRKLGLGDALVNEDGEYWVG